MRKKDGQLFRDGQSSGGYDDNGNYKSKANKTLTSVTLLLLMARRVKVALIMMMPMITMMVRIVNVNVYPLQGDHTVLGLLGPGRQWQDLNLAK
ncbi:hypothetical protein PoB_003336800 [Plakobranchus ocellatus]|uniref:Uncharacterized protein n=1 Tax=Plakobranchus ocellatus TaxID=259542 RepID=A0AAV4AHZ6_9GAST|nr:hypothetical protein PoB_003336800 [Plakobranchus ocellatus]